MLANQAKADIGIQPKVTKITESRDSPPQKLSLDFFEEKTKTNNKEEYTLNRFSPCCWILPEIEKTLVKQEFFIIV